TGEDNGQEHTRYFEKLVGDADLKQLGVWLVELALVHCRDHTSYYYYGDGLKPDPLFETATRWGIDVEAIKAVVTGSAKRSRTEREPKPKRAHETSAS
ncbi:MAG: hypothetical protein ACRD2B_11435, partial [Terriglobia bacterium]